MRVLFLTPGPEENASARHRVYQFVPYIQAAGVQCIISPALSKTLYRKVFLRRTWMQQIGYWFFVSVTRMRDLLRVRNFDLIFMQREVLSRLFPVFELAIACLNPKIVFDLDDNLFRIPYANDRGLLYRLGCRIFVDRHNIERIVRESKVVVIGSPYLLDYVRPHNQNVVVIPTAVDLQKYTPRKHTQACSITIGWIGSASTSVYLHSMSEVFQQLAERFGNKIRFIIIGDPNFEPLIPQMHIKPFVLEKEINDLHEMDIGIMPLDDNEWTRGKCAFKAIQYMAIGIPVVSSPVGVAQDIVRHGENGYLAKDTEDWVYYLSLLIEDADLRQHLGKNGRQLVEQYYSVQAVFPKLLELLKEAAE